jgi:hypothetical protein
MTIEQLFGTLQQSVVDIWREHLKTDSYSGHMAMDEYYKDMPDLIDDLIEHYMGRYGKIMSYESILSPGNFTDPAEYLSALREMVSQTYDTISASELKSDLDAVLAQIDSTVYKLRELTESCDIEFTLEPGLGEPIPSLIECGGSCSGGSCKKGTKRDKEEEEVLGRKKKPYKKYPMIDKEEEEVLGRKKKPYKPYPKESLSDFLYKTI